MQEMEKYAVIVAGGSGTRMGITTPKQFLLLNGKPIIYYTLEAFLSAFPDLKIVLVLPASFINTAADITRLSSFPERITVCEGGSTRFHSVQNGLRYVSNPSIVFVHDGVRCLVSPKLIQHCYQQALDKGNAIPAITVTDSIRQLTPQGTQAIDRNSLRAIQTPQTFRSDVLLPAFDQPYTDAFTDEATVIEAVGHTVHLIEGEKENIKITYQGDISTANYILDTREKKTTP